MEAVLLADFLYLHDFDSGMVSDPGSPSGPIGTSAFVRNSLQGPFSVLTHELDELHAVGTLWTEGACPL